LPERTAEKGGQAVVRKERLGVSFADGFREKSRLSVAGTKQ